MSPVQEGSVVVYVIDNSGSLEPHKEALFDAFDDLTGRASLPNVQLAALKHGYSGTWERDFHSVETLKNSLFAFRPPDDTLANTLRGELSFSHYYEQLYPGIMAAWKMIEVECPKDVDLDAKPWCERKVIVALSDGDPGMSWTNADYFPQPDAFLPTNLLSGLQKAGIRVDTLCTGRDCEIRMGRCEWVKKVIIAWFQAGCSSPPAGLLGREIMAAISDHTGGKHHDVAD